MNDEHSAYPSAFQLECDDPGDADEGAALLMKLIWEAFARSAPDNKDSSVSL